MAIHNAWAMLRNAILDPAGVLNVDDANPPDASPWVRAVHEGWEEQLRGNPSRSGFVLPNELPQQTNGAPIGSALWPPLPAGSDSGAGRMPLSPLFLPYADRPTMPPHLPHAWGRNGADAGMSQLATWPESPAFNESISPLGPTPVHYDGTVRPRPRPAFPDIFDPWREHFIRGIRGIQGLFNSRSRPNAGDPSAPGCKEEWDEARKLCAGWLASPKPPRGLTGGYKNIEDCARGLVSERCGGNPYR